MGRRIGTMGLVNYKDHPTDNRYKVFNFNSVEEAEMFEAQLVESNVWFEKDEEVVENKATIQFTLDPEGEKFHKTYLFAVEQRDFDKAQKFNFNVSAKYRKPFIKYNLFKIVLLLFFFAFLGLAIFGYIKTNLNS